jgi:hypothetical protein
MSLDLLSAFSSAFLDADWADNSDDWCSMGDMLYSIMIILLFGVLGSKLLLVPVQNLSIKHLLMLQLSLFEYKLFLMILEYLRVIHLCCGVTIILELHISHPTQYFMLVQNILKWISVLLEKGLPKSCFESRSSHRRIN